MGQIPLRPLLLQDLSPWNGVRLWVSANMLWIKAPQRVFLFFPQSNSILQRYLVISLGSDVSSSDPSLQHKQIPQVYTAGAALSSHVTLELPASLCNSAVPPSRLKLSFLQMDFSNRMHSVWRHSGGQGSFLSHFLSIVWIYLSRQVWLYHRKSYQIGISPGKSRACFSVSG